MAHAPRFITNSADAAIQYAEAGGGLTRVMFYQAAAALKAGRLKIVLAKFEQAPLPIHLVYPTSRLLSAKVRAFIDLVTETATGVLVGNDDSHRHSGIALARPGTTVVFFGTTRNVRVGACDHDVVGLDETLREADRAAGLDHVAFDREPLSDLRGADEIDREADRHQRRYAAHDMRAAIAHRVVGKRRDQPAVN